MKMNASYKRDNVKLTKLKLIVLPKKRKKNKRDKLPNGTRKIRKDMNQNYLNNNRELNWLNNSKNRKQKIKDLKRLQRNYVKGELT
jgi:hypothetical protein